VSIFPTKILLANDGSKEAELAATTAAGLTKTTGPGLHVLNVEGARDVLDEQVKKKENLDRVVARGHASTGDLAKEVLNLAEEGRWPDSYGESGQGQDQEPRDWRRVGLGGQTRPLPRLRGSWIRADGALGWFRTTGRSRGGSQKHATPFGDAPSTGRGYDPPGT
jgi:hypothetical protein